MALTLEISVQDQNVLKQEFLQIISLIVKECHFSLTDMKELHLPLPNTRLNRARDYGGTVKRRTDAHFVAKMKHMMGTLSLTKSSS